MLRSRKLKKHKQTQREKFVDKEKLISVDAITFNYTTNFIKYHSHEPGGNALK
jgi:hypothetical protein